MLIKFHWLLKHPFLVLFKGHDVLFPAPKKEGTVLFVVLGVPAVDTLISELWMDNCNPRHAFLLARAELRVRLMENRRAEPALSQTPSATLLTILQMGLKVPHCIWEEYRRGLDGAFPMSSLWSKWVITVTVFYCLDSSPAWKKNKKSHLLSFVKEVEYSLRALKLRSRKNQDSAGNHFLLEFWVQFTLLAHQEEVWIISALKKKGTEPKKHLFAKDLAQQHIGT